MSENPERTSPEAIPLSREAAELYERSLTEGFRVFVEAAEDAYVDAHRTGDAMLIAVCINSIYPFFTSILIMN